MSHKIEGEKGKYLYSEAGIIVLFCLARSGNGGIIRSDRHLSFALCSSALMLSNATHAIAESCPWMQKYVGMSRTKVLQGEGAAHEIMV
ncbi:hypothetical protein BDZ85DRAFT_269372 [Elsinoe ampelina]|uniref:Uncharacterized protein n=1 Tax=Elsinoe ampelina TaxID=302913 RepID=A0A6A6FZV4_9PEZI|nr:hypothetical protein BDZ85DRAFT_269372 [Elsinoe ampelina]